MQFLLSESPILNETVRDCGIKIIIGDKGAGKDRFLDWWWQVGATHRRVPEPLHVSPADVVLINLMPAPCGSVPMACVALSMIWHSLKVLEHGAYGSEPVRPTGRIKHLHTEAQFLRLFFEHILPLMQTLQPRVVVVGNAQYLDERALHWLLLLRTHAEQGHPLLPRHALILSAQVEPGGEESSKFARLMNGHSETRLAWPHKLLLSPMDGAEFATIIATLIRRNLNAIFDEGVDATETTSVFYEWTQGNWWYIKELARRLDHVLGPRKEEDKPRVITGAVIKRLQDVWVSRVGKPAGAAAKEDYAEELA